jgi:hypothetical protein
MPRDGAHTHRIYFLQSLSTIPVPESLLRGVPVVHVAANSKTQPATLQLSPDKFTVTLHTQDATPSLRSTGFFSKSVAELPHRAIDIGEMDRILRGQSTRDFEKARKALPKSELFRQRSATTALSLDPARSFSIIFRGAHTLDLMVISGHAERDELCTAINSILQAYQFAKVRVAPDVLLLRYVWLRVVVESVGDHRAFSRHHPNSNGTTGHSTVAHWHKILREIGFIMKPKEVVAAYEQFGKVIGLDRAARRRLHSYTKSNVIAGC